LWARWRGGADAAAREELISRHLGYARIVAASYYARRLHDEIEFDEYLQFASLGLVESVDRFDPAVGAQFKTFAARRMHGAILSGVERLTEKQQQIAARQRLRRERVESIKDRACEAGHPSNGAGSTDEKARATCPEALFGYLAEVGIGLALSCLLEGTGMVDDPSQAPADAPDTHYQPVELRQLQRHVRELVGRLSDQEQIVIRYHYLQERGFDEVAVRLGVTKGRVAQIHRKALAALRAHLDARRRCDIAW
jgi:RNA polymerase sigma factor for flagellar operon FliA